MNTIASWSRWCEDKKSLKVISLFSNAIKLKLSAVNYDQLWKSLETTVENGALWLLKFPC